MAARMSVSQMTPSLMMRRRMLTGLFFSILAGHPEKMIEAGHDAVERENDQQIGRRVQPAVEKISDRQSDGNGGREHQADDRKIDPAFVFLRIVGHGR